MVANQSVPEPTSSATCRFSERRSDAASIAAALEADLPTMKSEIFEALRDVSGMGTPATVELLARLSAALPAGAMYLEAGSFEGRSALAVALASDLSLTLVDDFSMNTREALMRNLTRFGVTSRCAVIDGPVDTVLPRATEDGTVALFFYDADHSFRSTLLALLNCRPLLCDNGVIVIDDAEWPQVRLATDRFLAENVDFDLVARFDGIAGARPEWWHGVDVLQRRPSRPN